MIGSKFITNLFSTIDFSSRSLRRKLLFIDIVAFFFFMPVSVSGSQVAVVIGLALIFPDIRKNWQQLLTKPFVLPLALFIFFSLTAILFSTDWTVSLESAKQLLLVLVIPLVFFAVQSYEELKLLMGVTALSTLISAIFGIYQVATATGGGTHGYRLTGILGHYMTAGGIFMIIAVLMSAVAIFVVSGRHRFIASSIAFLSIMAVLLTQSRNAYVGLVFSALALVLVWKKKLVFLLPFVFSLAVLLSPDMVRDRMFRVIDMEDASVQTRIAMMETGIKMMSDYPLFGIGLGQVEIHYNHYKEPASAGNVPHLHNNVLQIGAERGIPALIVWIWMLYSFSKSLFKMSQDMSRRRWRRGLASGAFAVIVALFTAGMFEFNFGDTEVQMLFWAVITLPFAAARIQDTAEQEN